MVYALIKSLHGFNPILRPDIDIQDVDDNNPEFFNIDNKNVIFNICGSCRGLF